MPNSTNDATPRKLSVCWFMPLLEIDLSGKDCRVEFAHLPGWEKLVSMKRRKLAKRKHRVSELKEQKARIDRAAAEKAVREKEEEIEAPIFITS